MQRILVLNPKGGSGKTTIATNLASYFASQGDRPLLSDNDPQGSSTRWLKKRKPEQPFIYGIATFERNTRMTARGKCAFRRMQRMSWSILRPR